MARHAFVKARRPKLHQRMGYRPGMFVKAVQTGRPEAVFSHAADRRAFVKESTAYRVAWRSSALGSRESDRDQLRQVPSGCRTRPPAAPRDREKASRRLFAGARAHTLTRECCRAARMAAPPGGLSAQLGFFGVRECIV